MANAGCINAYDCDWCLIQTLQQLDSSNIGVGVQYVAPNPLDDKRLDYIKYTDKCWCIQCITNENEILIRATQWVLKNLTLTNDEDNEVVNVKRTEVFWSNWKKTVVRYKVWSYPTDITDWTLAVESLVKNQYEVSWFDVEWLEDWTTYYFSAFAVAQDDTIIVVQSWNIVPSFKRKPWVNTVFYAPLISDNKDTISWNSPYSTRWSFSYDWISCRFSTASMYWNIINWNTSFTSPRTIFQILKPVSRHTWWYSSRLWYPMRNNTTTWWFEIRQTWTTTQTWNPKFWMTEWTSAWNRNNWRDMPLNERHIFITVYTWSKLYVYRDWVVYDYSPIIWTTTWWWFSPVWNASVMRMWVNNQYDYYDWFVAHLWFEKVARDEAMVQKFFKTFKNDYWL